MIGLLLTTAQAADWDDPCIAWGRQHFGTVVSLKSQDPNPSKLVRVSRSWQEGGKVMVAHQWAKRDLNLCYGDVISTWYGVKVEIHWSEAGNLGYAVLDEGTMLQLGAPSKLYLGAASFFFPASKDGAIRTHLVFGRAGEEGIAGSPTTSFRAVVADPSSGIADIAVSGVEEGQEVFVGEGADPPKITSGQAGRVVPGSGKIVPLDAPKEAAVRQQTMLDALEADRRDETTPPTEGRGAGDAVVHLLLTGHAPPVQVTVDGIPLPEWRWDTTVHDRLGFATRSVEALRLAQGSHRVEVWSAPPAPEGALLLDEATVTVAGDGDLVVARKGSAGRNQSLGATFGSRIGYARTFVGYALGPEEVDGQINALSADIHGQLRVRVGGLAVLVGAEWLALETSGETGLASHLYGLEGGVGTWSGPHWLEATAGVAGWSAPAESGCSDNPDPRLGTPTFCRAFAPAGTLRGRWDMSGRSALSDAVRFYPFAELEGQVATAAYGIGGRSGATASFEPGLEFELAIGASYDRAAGSTDLSWGTLELTGGVRWSSF